MEKKYLLILEGKSDMVEIFTLFSFVEEAMRLDKLVGHQVATIFYNDKLVTT